MSATVEPPETPDLREAAVHGVRWAAMVRGAAEVVLMASMILLARLISPTEFGYFAVAIIAQELAIVITAEGIGTALVQRKTVDREHLQAGLALALVTGLVFMVLDARGGRSDRLADLRRAHRRLRPPLLAALPHRGGGHACPWRCCADASPSSG